MGNIAKVKVVLIGNNGEECRGITDIAKNLGIQVLHLQESASIKSSKLSRKTLFLIPDDVEHSQLHSIRLSHPGAKVAMYATNPDPRMVLDAIGEGVYDYIIFPDFERRLIACLNRILAEVELGGTTELEVSSREVASDQLIARFCAELDSFKLTRRETEVMKLVCLGQSSKQIGSFLSISPRTVEVHRAAALVRLKAKNGSEAVAKFVRMSIKNELLLEQ